MSEKYTNLQKTRLAWDPYMRYLVLAIDEADYLKRAEAVPMMSPKKPIESNINSRAVHVRETADIAKEIAAALGLNDDLAYVGMLLHDAGHPFSAHEGEVIFSEFNEIYNIQYFHHNSKGLGIIWQERILEDALSRIPNLTSELEKQLRDEFYYFLDIVISHDGEARKEDLEKKAVKYDTLQEAVEDKANKANSENNYKFIAQTPEGQVAKYSDVIAYLATDIQDAFRWGFLDKFDEEYLMIIGTAVLGDRLNENTKQEDVIKVAKERIEQLQHIKLREQFKDTDNETDKQLMQIANNINKDILELKKQRKDIAIAVVNNIIANKEREIGKTLDEQEKKKILKDYLSNHPLIQPEEIQDRIEEEKAKYKKLKNPQNSDEILECNSEMDKIEEFTNKFLGMPLTVVKSIIQQIQDFLINDIIENSKPNEENSNNMPTFSQRALDLINNLKIKNMKEFVIDTKWEYQKKEYPQVVLKIVPQIAANLLRAGTIRNKFGDRSIRERISSKDALKYMRMRIQQDGKSEDELIKYLPKKIKSSKSYKRRIFAIEKNKGEKDEQKYKVAECTLTKDIIQYINEKGQSFVNQYMYTFNAIPHRIRAKVKRAFSDEPEKEKKNEYYDSIIQKQLNTIRSRFIKDFELTCKTYSEVNSAFKELDDIDREEFIQKLIDEDRQNMEYKMALQMTSDYLAGLNDETFKQTAIDLGYLQQDTIDNAKRGRIKSVSVERDLAYLENK